MIMPDFLGGDLNAQKSDLLLPSMSPPPTSLGIAEIPLFPECLYVLTYIVRQQQRETLSLSPPAVAAAAALFQGNLSLAARRFIWHVQSFSSLLKWRILSPPISGCHRLVLRHPGTRHRAITGSQNASNE